MDSRTIALSSVIARSQAEKIARSIVPERGPRGRRGQAGPMGLQGPKGDTGAAGEQGMQGKDGRDGTDGKDGIANAWHLVYGEPEYDFGNVGDFALNGEDSNVYVKHKGGWRFVVHLKAETPSLQMQAPRAYSEQSIQDITMDNYTDIEYLADQSGAGGVLTFTFSSDVDLIVVELVETAADADAGAIEGRATTGTQTPTATLGAVLKHECPIPLQVTTDTCKVYAPADCNITVYGKRR